MAPVNVSIVVPIHNGTPWIDRCFSAILHQQQLAKIKVEVCVCDDSSIDNSAAILKTWKDTFKEQKIPIKIYTNKSDKPRGVGYAKNKAVSISSGTYLCFQDIDDVMLPNRLIEQYRIAREQPINTIVGSRFRRLPDNSTARFTKWANRLTQEQLMWQTYTSHGPTVIMPTWFCHRSVFDKVGGFSEGGRGTPEDLIFFYRHLDLGGRVFRADGCLLIYYYHPLATTFSINEQTIWDIRVERLQRRVLSRWQKFTIWNGGKQGRKLYGSLTADNREKVVALCDVDAKKIGKTYAFFDEKGRRFGRPVDIIHYLEASPPFVICVKMDLTNDQFENNLKELHLTENEDYIMFS